MAPREQLRCPAARRRLTCRMCRGSLRYMKSSAKQLFGRSTPPGIAHPRLEAQYLAELYCAPLASQWTVEGCCATAAQRCGIDIHIEAVSQRPFPTGMAIRHGGRGAILVRDDVFGVHRDHVILHELCHLLCGHGEDVRGCSGRASSPPAGAAEELAEVFATEVLRWVERTAARPRAEAEVYDFFCR